MSISIAQQNEIKNRLNGGETKVSLAREFDTSERTIRRIELGEYRGGKAAQQQPVQPNQPTAQGAQYYVTGNFDRITIGRMAGDTIDTIVVENGEKKFNQVLDLLLADKSQDTLAKAYALVDTKAMIMAYQHGNIKVDSVRGVVVYDDGTHKADLPTSLMNRIMSALEAGDNASLTALAAFTNKLLAGQPSPRLVRELYDFLQASDIKIGGDGGVIAYKKVRDDYMDVYTGTISNRVGTEPSMPRSMVNDDSRVTCSSGLHVCSKAYLNHYPGDRVMICKIEPQDFVSIPEDYYAVGDGGQVKAKARVTKYKVIGEIRGGDGEVCGI